MMSKQWIRGLLTVALVVGSVVTASRNVRVAQAAEASAEQRAAAGTALNAKLQPSRPEAMNATAPRVETPAALAPTNAVDVPAAKANKPVPYTQPGEPPAHLRRLTAPEVPVPMRAGLHTLLRQHSDAKVGALIPTTFDGKTYIARIETHYHPEGGPVRPWGNHRGISLFVERE